MARRRSRSRRRFVRAVQRPQAVAVRPGAISIASREARLPRSYAVAALARRITRFGALPLPNWRLLVNRPRSFQRKARLTRRQRRVLFPTLDRSPVFRAAESFCRSRKGRREVMFSLDVAGRSWGSGGPRMVGAKRRVESSFSCRG